METISDRLVHLFSPARIAHHVIDDVLPDVIVAGMTYLAFYLCWRLADRAATLVFVRAKVDQTANVFLRSVLKYAVLAMGVVTSLAQLGVDTGSVLASLGIAGLTLGFAARDALSNLISGLFIFWDRPFVVGDLVEIDGNYGRVDLITMRSTRVVTKDGRMLAISNSQVLNSTVASYTNFPRLRLDIDITIGTGEDLSRARALLLALVEGDARFVTDPAPRVVVTAINDYNIAIQLQAWLENERHHVEERFELRERCFEALREAGVEMPLECFQLAPFEVRQNAA